MSSSRSIRQLAKRAGIEATQALRLLADAGYPYISASQSVAQRRLTSVEVVLGLRPKPLAKTPAPAAGGTTAVDLPVEQPAGDPPARAFPDAGSKRAKGERSGDEGASPGPLRHQYDLPVVGHPPSGPMRHLNGRAVLDIHYQLVDDFATSADPIDPPGPRGDGDLLESALTRPQTSLNRRLKYPTVEMAGAALLHALVQDHPFHNGNKRTGIVAVLVFLDQNGYVLEATEDELFDFVLGLASHQVPVGSSRIPVDVRYSPSDSETLMAAEWVSRHARKLNKSQRTLKWKELEGLLRGFGCTIEKREGNSIVIRRDNLTVHSGRRNLGDECESGEVARIRKALELDETHGVDSSTFYYNASAVPTFINKYRQLLRKLAPY